MKKSKDIVGIIGVIVAIAFWIIAPKLYRMYEFEKAIREEFILCKEKVWDIDNLHIEKTERLGKSKFYYCRFDLQREENSDLIPCIVVIATPKISGRYTMGEILVKHK